MAKRMGDFMLETGEMKQYQVEAVASLQKAGDNRRFGEIAVALGYIRPEAIGRYVAYVEKQGGT